MDVAVQYQTHSATDFDNDIDIDNGIDKPRAPRPSANWVYHCAMSLLQHPADDAISQMLAHTGDTSGADRSWMIEYRPDMLRFRNTHEWCRGQTQPFVAELQDVPTTLIAWLHRFMVKGHAVAIHNVHDLPRTARIIQAEFVRQGNKSVLSVPVFHDKTLYGIVGFDTTLSYRRWSAEEVNALYRCANLIGQAKYSNSLDHNRKAMHESSLSVVYLNMRGVVRGVPPETIVGVRSAGNYSEIWLADGSMVLDSRALGMWSTLLPEKLFFRVHRTAIANVLHVMEVDRRSADKWRVRMRSVDSGWPVSRAYRKTLRERMGI